MANGSDPFGIFSKPGPGQLAGEAFQGAFGQGVKIAQARDQLDFQKDKLAKDQVNRFMTGYTNIAKIQDPKIKRIAYDNWIKGAERNGISINPESRAILTALPAAVVAAKNEEIASAPTGAESKRLFNQFMVDLVEKPHEFEGTDILQAKSLAQEALATAGERQQEILPTRLAQAGQLQRTQLTQESQDVRAGLERERKEAKLEEDLKREDQRIALEERRLNQDLADKDFDKQDRAAKIETDAKDAFQKDNTESINIIKQVNKMMALLDKSGLEGIKKWDRQNAWADDAIRVTFAKMIDPRTGVREGEVARLMGLSGGKLATFVGTLQKWWDGRELTPLQKKQIAEAALMLGRNAEGTMDRSAARLRGNYERGAFQKVGVDVDRIYSRDSLIVPKSVREMAGLERKRLGKGTPTPKANIQQLRQTVKQNKIPRSIAVQQAIDAIKNNGPKSFGKVNKHLRSLGFKGLTKEEKRRAGVK